MGNVRVLSDLSISQFLQKIVIINIHISNYEHTLNFKSLEFQHLSVL